MIENIKYPYRFEHCVEKINIYWLWKFLNLKYENKNKNLRCNSTTVIQTKVEAQHYSTN